MLGCYKIRGNGNIQWGMHASTRTARVADESVPGTHTVRQRYIHTASSHLPLHKRKQEKASLMSTHSSRDAVSSSGNPGIPCNEVGLAINLPNTYRDLLKQGHANHIVRGGVNTFSTGSKSHEKLQETPEQARLSSIGYTHRSINTHTPRTRT